MKIVIIAQEEPVYFSPFFRGVIEDRPQDIKLIVLIGDRGAGGHPKTFSSKLKYLYSLWLLLEPKGFFKHLWIRIFQKFLRKSKWDQRSLEGIAKEKNIEIFRTNNPNNPSCLEKLKTHAPDVIINQSELLLKKELLSIPKIGILNRHASLLPNFRGRVGSFWAHAETPPEYGVTIHFVDQEIDSGPIIAQKKYNLDPKLSYEKILDILFKESLPLMLEALDKLKQKNFIPTPNNYQGTPTYKFPTLKQIQEYRNQQQSRRNQ